ncbi:hypothetical protein M9Y10_008815 [Tritrichomonas musculus]|uniref:F5/8 type C domain-containing protein n=1 Tax=Tritrichomonas musculus TaxID=1915356 RepID=A0ABR2IZ39_9EUKA
MSEEYILILNDQEIKFHFNSKWVPKLGESISDSLISSKKYFIKSKVSRANFDIFLDFLNEKIGYPSIDPNNYYDYYQLSKEFNDILENYLSKREFDEFCKISMLENAKTNENIDKQLCILYISENLDYYLQYQPNNLSKIPYQTLYNIFRHEKRILNNHENAYQFIKQILNESNANGDEMKKSICVLIGTLDGNKLNEESLKESISMKEEHFGFVPKINSTIFNSFNDIVSNLKDQLLGQQIQIFNDIKVYFDSKIDSIQSNNQNVTKEITETKNLVTNLSERIQSIENNIQLILNHNNDTQNKIQSIVRQIDDLKNNQNQTLQKCEKNIQQISDKIIGIESNINQISNTNNGIQNKMQDMANQVNEIKDKSTQIYQKCDSTHNSIQQIPGKITNIENNMNQISNRNSEMQNMVNQINEIKDKSTQIYQKCDSTHNSIQQIPGKITNIENNIRQISNSNTEIQNKMQDMKNQVNEIKDKNVQIYQKCDNANNSIQQIPSKISGIESDAKKIFNKVSETLDISIARFGLFRGIIHQMTEECGGNVSDKGRVNVTSSSFLFGNPKNAVDLDDNQTCFVSRNQTNSWLKYDFIYRKVRPSVYSIRSRNKPKGDHHPMNWVIEGSNTDSNDWTILDTRNNVTSLDDSCASQFFSIQKADTFYRYIRIRQTGPNSANHNYLIISALEYFGSIQ